MEAAILDRLTDLVTSSGWTYAAIAGLVAADAVLPLIPGETVVLTAGILASQGELSLPLVLIAALAGGFGGDNASFGIGRTVGERAARRLLGGGRGRRLLAWSKRQLHAHGAAIIVAARFVPGGRTAATFASGTVGLPWRRFAIADLVAASLWAVYITLLGYLGGETFKGNELLGLATSLAVALLVGVAAELTRRLSSRHPAA